MSEAPFRHSVPRPTGPTKRQPLERMSLLNDTMARSKNKSKNKSKDTSNTGLQTSPPHSTPKKNPDSPNLDEESKKLGKTAEFEEYAKLRKKLRDSNLDESSNSESHSHQSSSEIQSNDATTSNQSYTEGSSYQLSVDEVEQRLVNRSREPSNLNDLGNTNGQKISGLSYESYTLRISTTLVDSRESSKLNNLGNANRQKKSGSSYKSCIALVGIIVAILACSPYLYLTLSKKTEESSKIDRLIENIKNLKGLFPSQDNSTWSSFGSGIQEVLTKEHRPAIFVLIALHDKTTECLAKKVAELASSTLGGTGDVTLTPDKLENNKSRVFEGMENQVNQTKAVVVLDLLSMQPEAFQAFHYILDEYNPMIAEAVYLFTMSTRIRNESERLNKFVEKELMQKFSSVITKEGTLEALITRFTAGDVLVIREEEIIPCSR